MNISDKHQISDEANELSGAKQSGIIRVQGTGEVAAVPDIAYVNFGVEAANAELAAAQSAASRIMSSVMKALETAGVTAGNIQTNHFSITPRYEYSGGVSKKNGYQVQNTIRVKLTDLGSAGKIIDAVTAAGANVFHGIEFSLTDKSGHYHNALKNALDAAREKAQLIAGSENVKLGRVASVIEQGAQDASLFMREARTMTLADPASTPVSAGKLNIKAAVEVTYLIV